MPRQNGALTAVGHSHRALCIVEVHLAIEHGHHRPSRRIDFHNEFSAARRADRGRRLQQELAWLVARENVNRARVKIDDPLTGRFRGRQNLHRGEFVHAQSAQFRQAHCSAAQGKGAQAIEDRELQAHFGGNPIGDFACGFNPSLRGQQLALRCGTPPTRRDQDQHDPKNASPANVWTYHVLETRLCIWRTEIER